jgi:hypothetical protein
VTHLDGTIAGVSEIVSALGGTEEVEELADLSPGGFEVARLSLSEEMFELGEELFDGIEVGAGGRQEDEAGAFGSDDGSRAALPLWLPRLSRTTTSPGERVGARIFWI